MILLVVGGLVPLFSDFCQLRWRQLPDAVQQGHVAFLRRVHGVIAPEGVDAGLEVLALHFGAGYQSQ